MGEEQKIQKTALGLFPYKGINLIRGGIKLNTLSLWRHLKYRMMTYLDDICCYLPKVVYIDRNPEDVAVSLFNLHKFMKTLETNLTLIHFLFNFFGGRFPWFDHVNDWYAHKDEFDTLSLTYEDMIKDTRGALVKISNFLGKNLDENTIDTIVDKSSFKNMKEDPQARSDIQHPAFFKQSGSLIRKGKFGDWKTMFTVAQSEMFDKIYMEKMKDLPLEFDWEL